tara:strand:+ start:256 stop:423 length:168 start_codon:yes stop_codon:yes gene_type:complete
MARMEQLKQHPRYKEAMEALEKDIAARDKPNPRKPAKGGLVKSISRSIRDKMGIR